MAIRRGSGYSFRSGSYSPLRSRKRKNDPMEKHEVGVEAYVRFEKQVWQLKSKLRELCNEARSLGGSAAILSTSTRLRESLGRILHLFRQNAQTLYPEEMQAHSHSLPTKSKRNPKLRSRLHDKIRQYFPAESGGADNMAIEFRAFSKDVKTLFKCFNQIPEFEQELPEHTISKDLKHWVDSLDNFEHDFDTLAAQTYLHDCMVDIGDLLEIMAKGFIPVFTKFGIPAIRATQEHDTSNIQNQTLVATLFAGVATGMIQVYSSDDNSPLHEAIVLLWYMTLLFSIGSTVNGLLGLCWTQAIYRSPNNLVPWWILIWIKRFPLVFLVLAVACSFVALVLFAFLPQQNLVTRIITTALSISSCCGLAAVSSWFGGELLVFYQYRGRMWLSDAIGNMRNAAKTSLQHAWSEIQSQLQRCKSRPTDIEMQNNPDPDGFWARGNKDAMNAAERAQYRWQEAVRRIRDDRRPRTARRIRPSGLHLHRMANTIDHWTTAAIASLQPQTPQLLRTMTILNSYKVHADNRGMIHSLQFSPNGQFLVSSGLSHEATIWRISDYTMTREFVLAHPASAGVDYVHQVTWSPDGGSLLMRSHQNLVAWNVEIPRKSLHKLFEHKPDIHERAIYGASWNGDGSKCFSIQGRRVLTMVFSDRRSVRYSSTNMDTNIPQVLQDYPTQYLELRDVCVTSDSSWMICIGKYMQVNRSIGKYGIIVWDLRVRKVAKHIPVYYAISKVALGSDNTSVLVSYANNKSPSQFWRLAANDTGVDFTLRHSYIAHDNTSFSALPSIFGGEYDHLVLRATAVGGIYVWDRDSAEILHCIQGPPGVCGSITSFAWNRGLGNYMFATGTRDGTIHIWGPGDGVPNWASHPAVTS